MAEYFTCTSEDSYDKYDYKVYYYDKKPKIVRFYDEAINEWMSGTAKLIEVIDKPNKKKFQNKGFK